MEKQPYIGSMYHKIEIQSYTIEKKQSGEEMPLWSTFQTVKAAVSVGSLDETDVNNRQIATETIEFKIRTISGLNAKMRIIWNNVVYEIKGINPFTRRYQLIKADKSLTWTDEYLTQTAITVDADTVTADKQNK